MKSSKAAIKASEVQSSTGHSFSSSLHKTLRLREPSERCLQQMYSAVCSMLCTITTLQNNITQMAFHPAFPHLQNQASLMLCHIRVFQLDCCCAAESHLGQLSPKHLTMLQCAPLSTPMNGCCSILCVSLLKAIASLRPLRYFEW